MVKNGGCQQCAIFIVCSCNRFWGKMHWAQETAVPKHSAFMRPKMWHMTSEMIKQSGNRWERFILWSCHNLSTHKLLPSIQLMKMPSSSPSVSSCTSSASQLASRTVSAGVAVMPYYTGKQDIVRTLITLKVNLFMSVLLWWPMEIHFFQISLCPRQLMKFYSHQHIQVISLQPVSWFCFWRLSSHVQFIRKLSY